MLTVINEDGTYSGVQYYTDEQRFRDHHAALGQTCIWIERDIDRIDPGMPTPTDLEDNDDHDKKVEMKRIDEESIPAMRSIILGKETDTKALSDLEGSAKKVSEVK